jgi:rhodanese-related sulfurtransferase
MNVIAQALLLLLLAGSAAVGAFYLHPRAPALYAVEEPLRDDEVTLAQIQERWQGNVLWLDARPREQFEAAHIPGALLLNEQDFDNQLFELLETLQTNSKPVVIYCGSERCDASRKIRAKLLERVPIDDCSVLKGGWPAWQAAKGK